VHAPHLSLYKKVPTDEKGRAEDCCTAEKESCSAQVQKVVGLHGVHPGVNLSYWSLSYVHPSDSLLSVDWFHFSFPFFFRNVCVFF
jgi:hypothetical protein